MNLRRRAGSTRSIPRDLETIVLKAMAKDPSSRYATAQELAADLRRFLDDRPIQARRPGPLERTLRWAFRHRELVATAAAILVLALSIGTAAIWSQARKTEAQARKTEAALRRRDAFIIEAYPLLHRLGTVAIGDANNLLLGACPRIHLCSGIGPRFSQGLGVSAWAPRSARTIPINPHRHCWTNAKS